jgi:intein/homing endonuclease
MVFDRGFAEFVGTIIGDGNIYDKGPSYVEICGDPKLDFDYMTRLSKIIERRFSFKNKIVVRHGGLRLRINNKNLVELLKDIGIPAGTKKGSNALIPKIFLSDYKLTTSCIRGIFDTDGCIFYDKRKIYKQPYVRICLHMKNRILLKQIARILNKRGIKASINSNGFNLSINGFKEVIKFLENIGFSNTRHTKRITPQ